jgi:hypothetical protein
MADTKWDDPNIDWDDVALGCPIHEAWQAIKEASDERNAYYNATDDTGFTGSETWPDLEDAALWFDNGAANLANYMSSALQYDEPNFESGTVDASTITTSGTFAAPASYYDLLTAQAVLDDFSWPSVGGNRLLHMNTTSDGVNSAPITKEWLKQWYQVLNFNVYNRSVIGVSSPYTDDVEQFYIQISISYSWVGGAFDNAAASVTNPEFATPVDIYVGGDLPEGSKATYQDVLDYGQSIFDSYFTDDTKWVSDTAVSGTIESLKVGTGADIVGADGSLSLDITYRGNRFKRVQGFRPTTGQRFDQEVWWNGLYIVPNDAQGTDEVNNIVKFIELPEEAVTLWIYFAVLANEGALPITTPEYDGSYNDGNVTRRTINDDNVGQQTVLFRPNLEDGTGFEYYTPAP